MAGQGWKKFNPGEVLRSVDFNGYAVDQSVQVYADSTARGTALGTAVSEGMMSYLLDEDQVQVYDGTDWVAVSGSSNVASDCIQPNFNTISENYTFPDSYNGVSAGPITIATGATVTVGTASAWSIV